MGDRYILTVVCPVCGYKDGDVYYAPTCNIKTWKCECGHVVDLENYTGISEADCSNADLIENIVNSVAKIDTSKSHVKYYGVSVNYVNTPWLYVLKSAMAYFPFFVLFLIILSRLLKKQINV